VRDWPQLTCLPFEDAQKFAPYSKLSAEPSEPKPTILLRRHILPITALIPLLYRGHVVPGSVAFTALVSELLIVALAGLPYRPGQLRGEFFFCAVATIVILALMLVELALVIWWRGHAVPHLPRRPDTVAAVMTYVVGAGMNSDYDGLEEVKESDRDKKVVALGKTYLYGEAADDHGVRRWMVDQLEEEDGMMMVKPASEGSDGVGPPPVAELVARSHE
jgi:hypothetical protein